MAIDAAQGKAATIDGRIVSEAPRGVRRLPIDAETLQLRRLAMSRNDIKTTRLALAQRQIDQALVDDLKLFEAKIAAALKRALRAHPIWPWLKQFPGLGGSHVAYLVGAIGDPRRFPGQACTIGHVHPPLYTVGSPCPFTFPVERSDESEARGGRNGAEKAKNCPGVMVDPRTTSGVKSLHRYLGLYADESGRSPRKRKGQRLSWNPVARASVMGKNGIADQIVRLRVEPYRSIHPRSYDVQKERLIRERGVVQANEIDGGLGSVNGAESAEGRDVSELTLGALRPIQIHDIARTIAVKAFIGDLLIAWKQIAEERR